MKALLFVVALASIPGLAAAVEVVRGPYLQTATETECTIKWRTDGSVTTGIWWGTEPGVYSDSLGSGPGKTRHTVRLAELEPSTRYYYALGNATARFPSQSPHQWFDTAPAAGSPAPTRVWTFGDSGLPGEPQNLIRDAFYAHSGGEHPDVWLLLGDNAYYEGTDAEYQAGFFTPFARPLAGTAAWSTRGNHDELYAGNENDYYDFFEFPTDGRAGGVPSGSEAYYAFDHGNVHFVCLDSEESDRTPGGPMLQWLAADLDATEKDWIVAYWHHAPYTKGSHDSDSEWRLIQMRENANPILEAHGVDLVLAGHSHAYERSYLIDGHYGSSETLLPSMILDSGDGDPAGDGPYVKPLARTPHAGTVYAVVGTGSVLHPGEFDHPVMATHVYAYGALVLDVDGPRLDGYFLEANGAIRDRFAIENLPVASAPGPGGLVAGSRRVAGPNPTRNVHTVLWELPASGHAEIGIFDAAGREVAALQSGWLESGAHRFVWDGESHGSPAPAGVYFLRAALRAEGGGQDPATVVRLLRIR